MTEMFARFATGEYSVKDLAAVFRSEGVKPRGRALNSSLVHQILRKRIYMGEFDFAGTTYQGVTTRWSPVNAGVAFRDSWMPGQQTKRGR
jgi:hypothetical protein